MKMTLSYQRGRRKREDFGLYYHTDCGRAAVYKADRFDGQRVPSAEIRWLAMCRTLGGCMRVVSRHRTRRAAERAVLKNLTPHNHPAGVRA